MIEIKQGNCLELMKEIPNGIAKINKMKIEPIIYETTRGIYSVEDKLSIASLILFSWKLCLHFLHTHQ